MASNATKEFTIQNRSCFKTMCGSLDKENPNVIYIKGRAKIQPVFECKSYTPYVKQVKESVGKFVQETFKSHGVFNKKFIFSCEVSENNLSTRKISNIRYELFIRPFEIKPVREYTNELTEISNSIEDILLTITDTGLFVIS